MPSLYKDKGPYASKQVVCVTTRSRAVLAPSQQWHDLKYCTCNSTFTDLPWIATLLLCPAPCATSNSSLFAETRDLKHGSRLPLMKAKAQMSQRIV
jgi:hypothetical protein